MAAWLPLLLALIGLAAVWLAAWLARDNRPASPGLALRMALSGIVILLGALGLYFAGDGAWGAAVLLAMALLVNLLGLSMWWHLRRIHKQGPRL